MLGWLYLPENEKSDDTLKMRMSNFMLAVSLITAFMIKVRDITQVPEQRYLSEDGHWDAVFSQGNADLGYTIEEIEDVFNVV